MAASSLKLRIDAQGNLGIGTLVPLHKLHVASGNVNVNAGNSYRINNVPVLTSSALGNTVVSSGLQTLGNLSAMNVSGNVSVQGNNLIINSVTNRVGLGTTSPSYALDVVGNVRATTYLQNGSAIVAAGVTFESFRGGNYFPADTADTTTIAGLRLSGTAKWAGGVLAPSGKIYGIPLDSDSVLIIDPAATPFQQVIQNKAPWGIYDAAQWSTATGTLPEARGNGRDVTSEGTIGVGFAAGNGASAAVAFINGSTTSRLFWPVGSIPSNFTICSITRYTGGTNERILQGASPNWLHGHWGGATGRAYYEKWMTSSSTGGGTTNWVVMCGSNGLATPSNILNQGQSVGTATGGSGNNRLAINPMTGETSDWALSFVVIWDQHLTAQEMKTVSDALVEYLANDGTTTITGVGTSTAKWNGGVLAPNGKIYGMPLDASSVLIIDPVTNTANTTTITGLSGSLKWVGCVLAPNGKIYGMPFNSTSVLIIDPVTNTANTTAITGLSGSGKWSGGVLAPNGKIYGIPRDASSVLIIDPVTNTANTTAITGLSGTGKWYGGVLAPNGKIYGIPYSSTSVLIIDPVTNTANTTTITGLRLSGTAKWAGGVLAPSGKIYGIPLDSDSVLIIDPAATPFQQVIQNKAPWGIYDAAQWSTATGTLPEARGNGRDVTSEGTIGVGFAAGNGASAAVAFINGSTTSRLFWPVGSIPSNFTICSITRYTGGTNERILQGASPNWLHGHWGGATGRAYYEKWMTSSSTGGGTTNWVVMCGSNGLATPSNILNQGQSVGTATGGSGNNRLAINPMTGETSDWALSFVVIWDQHLTAQEMKTVSDALVEYLANDGTTTITGVGTSTAKWNGGVLAPNGRIYGMPRDSTSVLILETGLPSVGKQDWMLRPYFNKF